MSEQRDRRQDVDTCHPAHKRRTWRVVAYDRLDARIPVEDRLVEVLGYEKGAQLEAARLGIF